MLMFLLDSGSLSSRSLSIFVTVMCPIRVNIFCGFPHSSSCTPLDSVDLLISVVIDPRSSRILNNFLLYAVPVVFAIAMVSEVSCLTFTELSMSGEPAEYFSTSSHRIGACPWTTAPK